MRSTRRFTIVILLAAGLIGAMHPAFAGSADENDFVARINSNRTSRGLSTLATDAHLADVARRHAQDMADRKTLYHNDSLGDQVSGWQTLGENVGEGGSVSDVDDAFMNSTEHRDNILGHYTKLGIGVVWSEGTLWVTEVFELPEQAAPAPAPAVAPAPVAPRPQVHVLPRWTPVRTAAKIPVRKPLAPIVPVAAALPLSSGRIEKLLGDLMIVPGDDETPPTDLAPPLERGLKALLWKIATGSSETMAA